jgi:hypothetical protein
VTVLDRDGGLPSVGEGQSSINFKNVDTRARFTYNIKKYLPGISLCPEKLGEN